MRGNRENHARNGSPNDEDGREEEGDDIDPLAPLPTFETATATSTAPFPQSQHMKTYTAGEDSSRLAAAARELGLQKHRRPRRQVRKPKSDDPGGAFGALSPFGRKLQQQTRHVLSLLLDTAMEDARMFSVYSSHVDRVRGEYDYDDDVDLVGQFWSSLPEFSVSEDELAVLRRKAREGIGGIEEGMVSEEGEELAEGEMIEDAHAHEVKGGSLGGSLTAAVLGIIKGMVGPAILYLPHGFASAGYLVALPIMTVTTVLFLYSSTCLLESWRHCHAVDDETAAAALAAAASSSSGQPPAGDGTNESTPLLDRHESNASSVQSAGNNNKAAGGGAAIKRRQMLSYPELAYRGLGVQGESIVKTGIALMQSGVCLTYLIFVPQNLHTSMKFLAGWDVPAQVWLILMIAIQVPLSWIRDIRKLTPTNLFANLLILYGLVTCLGFAFGSAVQGPAGNTSFQNIARHYSKLVPCNKDWFLFIGTSVSLEFLYDPVTGW